MIFRPCYFYFFSRTLRLGRVGFEKCGKFRTFFFETFPKQTLQTSVCYKQNQMINEILTELYLGHDMNACDYDKRTALHLAVAENHYNCVKYLVHTCKVEIHVKDR